MKNLYIATKLCKFPTVINRFMIFCLMFIVLRINSTIHHNPKHNINGKKNFSKHVHISEHFLAYIRIF